MTRRSAVRFLPVLLICFAILHAAPPAINTGKAGMDPELLARVPARVKAFVEKGTIPGAVTLVQRHGALASLEAVGYQDLESKQPMKRSEEHTSELQSHVNLVCRLLLEKKKPIIGVD